MKRVGKRLAYPARSGEKWVVVIEGIEYEAGAEIASFHVGEDYVAWYVWVGKTAKRERDDDVDLDWVQPGARLYRFVAR